MLVSFIALAIALITQLLSRTHPNDLEGNIFKVISRACLVISLIVAPWSLKLLIGVTVLLIPSCVLRKHRGLTQCSQQCIARSDCAHPHD
jgi:hypothetical protein